MKVIAFFISSSFFVLVTRGQVLSVENIFKIANARQASERFLSLKGFALTGRENRDDTFFKKYDYRRTKRCKDIDSIARSVTRAAMKDGFLLEYETASLAEFKALRTQLKSAGFYCNIPDVSDTSFFYIYQNNNLAVHTSMKAEDSIKTYSLQFYRKLFPRPRDIYYVNDLLSFNSHEYLVYYFGDKNVKKDVYILPGDKTAKCSVLFCGTNRQVVFIWADEENSCTIASLILGGQLHLKSATQTRKYIAENNWVLKSGVRPGMSINQLRMLNGDNFSFYGGNSASMGHIIPGNEGKLDFKKEEITLGCLNCNDDIFNTAKVVNADDSIQDGRIIFVLSVTFNPMFN
jgi:hypothetical protein